MESKRPNNLDLGWNLSTLLTHVQSFQRIIIVFYKKKCIYISEHITHSVESIMVICVHIVF